MFYKCKYFKIQELVPRTIYNARGEKSWELLDTRLLITIDKIREIFGPVIINNWSTGGPREYSGLRTIESKYYSPTSQHTFGRAADMLFSQKDTEEVRKYILDNPEEFPYITGIELNTSWLHIDCRNYDGVKVFKA